jgi:hypothetical protein
VVPGGRGAGSANKFKTPDYKIAFVTLVRAFGLLTFSPARLAGVLAGADCLLPFCVYTSCWVYFLVEIFCFSLNCSASQLFLESSPHCLPKTRGFVHSCIRPHTRRFLQAEEEEPFVYPDLFPDDEDEGKGTTGGASA